MKSMTYRLRQIPNRLRLLLILIVCICFTPHSASAQSTDVKVYDNSKGLEQESYLEWVSSTGKLLNSYYKSYKSVRDTLLNLYGEEAVSPIHGVEFSDDGFVFGFGSHIVSSFMMNYRVTVSNSGVIRQIEVFKDSLKAVGEISLTSNALRSAMGYMEQSSMPKPIDDTKYRRAVINSDFYQYLVVFSPQQNDDEHLFFGGEYAFWVEKVTGQFIGYNPWHKRVTRLAMAEYPGRLPVVLDKELAYLTPVDVALAIEINQSMPFIMGFGSFYVYRDGRVERLSDDNPMANPTIRSRN
jgi:hypothetical protein